MLRGPYPYAGIWGCRGWRPNQNGANWIIYYRHATIFHDEKILERVATLYEGVIVSGNALPSDFHRESETDLVIWSMILKKNLDREEADRRSASLKTSPHAARVVRRCRETLSSEKFSVLTSEQLMPAVHPDAAFDLLQVHDSYERLKQPEEEKKEPEELLSSLQSRCIDALAQKWSSIGTPESDVTADYLREQSPAFLAELMMKSLAIARRPR